MPNNITNQITFGSDSTALAAFQQMAQDMRMEGQPLGSIDFNRSEERRVGKECRL